MAKQIDQEQGFFYIIPAELIENGGGTKALLYGVISSFCKLVKGQRRGCWASNSFLAKKIHKKDVTIIRTYLTELEKEGWLYIENRGGKNREIFICIGPNPWKKPRVAVEKATGQPVEKTTPSNINISKINSNTVAPPNGDPTDGQKDSPENKDRPMNLPQFIAWCSKSSQGHIKIIGEWAETMTPEFVTVAQWEAYIKRNLRPAKVLVAFSHEQLEKGFERIKEAKREGWLSIATMETLFKFVTSGKLK